MKEPVYVIIPVHNRKAITLQCLENLKINNDLDKYHVVVVDDGSTDGTSEAIGIQYPDVILLHGDGNLWWTGAIKMGMEYAYEQGAEYFIWLNDDCYPEKGAIDLLINTCRFSLKTIVGAQSFDSKTGSPSYGGIKIIRNKIFPINALEKVLTLCDGLNGNLVCFPISVIDDIGYPPSDILPQYHGDSTYTKLAKNAGYILFINGKAISLCDNQHLRVSWLNPKKSILEYWQDYFEIGSPSYWKAEVFYYRTMLGNKGIITYFYQKIIRFWLFFLLNQVTSSSFRKSLSKSIRQ
ncbi:MULTISPECIES: glycosyltransferase family 2 protein [unclassified Synechocystis]|uniref:glycosyltransferase family 2 protein n=1 Tax=unclassified Synechocystis TaxID=2640012 RepID=UPI000421F567|nr:MULTISPECIES: glycosyltransferase family 2 protein [unclassified Synechocystis]MCT0252772.1 glycosyltransferase family 2 protein [Synechocystis sp. CS-94]